MPDPVLKKTGVTASIAIIADFDGTDFPGGVYGVTIQNLHATKPIELVAASAAYGTGLRIAAGDTYTLDEVTHGKFRAIGADAGPVDVRVFAWEKKL